MTNKSSTESRRKQPRRPVSFWANEHFEAAIHYCEVVNLSAGGVFLRTNLPLPVGEQVEIELPLPTGDVVRADGVTVHTGSRRQPGNGIAFRSVSNQDTLTAFLDTL